MIYFQNPDYRDHCAVCRVKMNEKMIVWHYLKCHPELEVYTSRLSADYAKKAQEEPPGPQYENATKSGQMRALCYFCGNEKTFYPQYWASHILSHTGEHPNKCGYCNKTYVTHTSHASKCPGSPIKLFQYTFTDGYLWAFMCKQCNFVRVRRPNMEAHLRNEHQFPDTELQNYYFHIKLISNRMCAPIADVKEEIPECYEEEIVNGEIGEIEEIVENDMLSSNLFPTAGSLDEMFTQQATTIKPPICTVQNSMNSPKIKVEPDRCVDEEVDIGYTRLDENRDELLSLSICQQLAQEPVSDETEQSEQMSTAEIRKIKTERFDGICV